MTNANVEVIDRFISDWVDMVVEYYIRKSEELNTAKAAYMAATMEELAITEAEFNSGFSNILKIESQDHDSFQENVRRRFYDAIKSMGEKRRNAWISGRNLYLALGDNGYFLMREARRPESLRQIIEKAGEKKRKAFIAKVEKKTGAITDVSGLTFGADGSLNGTVLGETGSATVRTIMAGGWNIQCFHFRVLVK